MKFDSLDTRGGLAVIVTWVGFSLANVGSHRDYQGLSVVMFVATGCVLMLVLVVRPRLRLPLPPTSAISPVLLAIGSVVVFQPTYLPEKDAMVMRFAVLAATLALVVLWMQAVVPATAPSLALGLVVFAVTAWIPIRGVPSPGNDVWYLLQQSNEGLVRGQNMYAMTWHGVPAGQVTDVFTYLPMSAVLLGPARWLTGDVRWGLAGLVLLSSVMLLLAAWEGRSNSSQRPWYLPACLLILTPGSPLQVEMSWTEPLQLFLLLGAVVALTRNRRWVAIGCLALALASKQHVWMLVPLFAVWRPFGVRKVGVAVLSAGVLCAPWLVADPRAMYADTVASYLQSGNSDRSSTIAATFGRLGLGLPTVIALIVLGLIVVGCCLRLRCADAGPRELCIAAALTLLIANLVNKQAYYNQWWLVGSLVLSSLAFSPDSTKGANQDGPRVSRTKAPA